MTDDNRKAGKPAGKYSVPGLDKGLDVLELLSDRAISMSQADIARALGRTTGEIFRTLSALEARRYIRRTEAGHYRLTLKLFELSRTHSPYEELLRVALPVMRRLSERIGETCHLTTLRDGEIVVLAQQESPRPFRLSIEVGSRHSPLTTTSGRILLAAMEEEDRLAFLSDYTSFHDLPEDVREAFLIRVRNVAERGYEIADGERFVGGLDVGVLVGTRRSSVRAALVVATLRSASGPDTEQILKALQEAGAEITERVGLGEHAPPGGD
ncbi:IclR family transcriptional regulator [Oricola thermophila]|uniref:IclR family transcriptional regulator n=1 Tax=Oricola thermophila TaxID=2742145 RepID=A0A6N1VIC1_9HYPH|nr:IclR family transcriptional regulator [Oricola thermophila]QKV19092.1 IclR family transcriptional regulator [Oricola thermophila]